MTGYPLPHGGESAAWDLVDEPPRRFTKFAQERSGRSHVPLRQTPMLLSIGLRHGVQLGAGPLRQVHFLLRCRMSAMWYRLLFRDLVKAGELHRLHRSFLPRHPGKRSCLLRAASLVSAVVDNECPDYLCTG